MYRLDLADPRLVLPVPVYRLSGQSGSSRLGTAGRSGRERSGRPIALFAPDRPMPGSVAVYEDGDGVLQVRAAAGSRPPGEGKPLFYALPADASSPAPPTVSPARVSPAGVSLYEFVHRDGVRRAYCTDVSWTSPGFRRSQRPVCLVWRDPAAAADAR